MEIKEGEVQTIKQDRKSFTIENIWFNNKFKELPNEFIKGSYVKVNYIIKNERNYWQSVEIIQKDLEVSTDIELNIPYQVSDTILMCVKDIICKELEIGKTFTEQELTSKIKRLTMDFKESYKLI
jgi:hypothetical protein